MYKNIPIQSIRTAPFNANDFAADILRLDLIHPVVSGNKWFKLKHHLTAAARQGKTKLLSFGGPYSNHLVAMADVAAQAGLKAVAVVRGEEPQLHSPALRQIKAAGTTLVFVSREAYGNKEKLVQQMQSEYPDHYIIPEGGQSALGIRGAAEILETVPRHYSHILCAVGTGTTLAGIANAAAVHQQVTGIAALKVSDPHHNTLLTFISNHTPRENWQVLFDYHFGGYARKNQELIRFMNELYRTETIPTDFVYTGKLLYAAFDLARNGYFPCGSAVLIIHSGGLQGNRSLPPGTLDFCSFGTT